jgi:hypothetical protein
VTRLRVVDFALVAGLAIVAVALIFTAIRRPDSPDRWLSLAETGEVSMPIEETLFTWSDCDTCTAMIDRATRTALKVVTAKRGAIVDCERQLLGSTDAVPDVVVACRKRPDADDALRFSAHLRAMGLQRLPALVRGKVVLYGARRISKELEQRRPRP